jgi:vitamin B12/bleomycin/antimicrobial peptide transport system ATP-binding/permease protein
MTRPRKPGNITDHRLRAQIWCLLRALFSSRFRFNLAILAIAIVAVVLATTYGQIELNAWQKSFWDALGIRSLQAVRDQVVVFLIIMGGLLTLGVAQNWLQAIIKIRLREWLTHDLFDEWLGPKRAYRLAHAGETGANPDQYIQADAQHLAEMSAGLSIEILQSGLLLVSFMGVLWGLSSGVVFTYDGQPFTIPGYMVWCALAYAGAGSILTWLVGRPLIKLNAERYAREADLRFAIVRLNESVESITLHGGERNERRLVNSSIADVIRLSVQLAKGHAKLTWVTSGYGWLAIIVPVLVASPGYFGGSLSLGGLMMVVEAFRQVQNALRWFVEHFAAIADWRATLLRVVGFRNRLAELTPHGGGTGGITVARHTEEKLEFQQLAILSPKGLMTLDAAQATIASGDRVLIAGACGSGKTRLLRAVAGLWPQGRGSILLPPSGDMMFVPPRPYMPLGTLRAALAYPSDARQFDELAIHRVLLRVGLARLASRLDEKDRWDKLLSASEQQRVGLARLLLHRPSWIFLEDTTGSMDVGDAQLMLSLFEDELAQSAVIGTGSAPALAHFYRRTLRLLPAGGDLLAPLEADATTAPLLLQAAE